MTLQSSRAQDLILTGGATGPMEDQLAQIAATIAGQGGQISDLSLLRAFYRHDLDEGQLRQSLAAALPPGLTPAVTFVPVSHAGAGDGALSIEAAAVCAPLSGLIADGPFARGLRRGRFLFLGGQAAPAPLGIDEETHTLMQELGRTLAALGADFGDVVRMNRWYHAGGTAAEWAPSALAAAAFYTEPGPIATALSLPVPLPQGRSIQIELMGIRGPNGPLPKTHSWPDGLWDWPIHLPYKHGLACDGFGFVGGQVSLDAQAQVIDPEHLDRQIHRSLANIGKVASGLGQPGRTLHLGCYFEIPPGGLAGSAPGAADLRELGSGDVPAALIGFRNLSYPKMRVEIEAIVELSPQLQT
jgi:enamine deaminase RidA (YjgF/YER057c/UK114 family)